jgi:hypothetical protein
MIAEHPPSIIVEAAIAEARRGPCRKSRRGAVAFAVGDPTSRIPCHNRPPPPLACDGSPACRAACGQICNHAEERAVFEWLRCGAAAQAAGFLAPGVPHAALVDFDVLHIEVDAEGEPVHFDREGKPQRPSCITCARLMHLARVRRVWLFGRAGWRSWTALDFLGETILELGLMSAPALLMQIGARR